MNRTTDNSLERLFLQGNYPAVLKARAGKVPRADAPVVLGALVFSGRLLEAEKLFALHAAELTDEQQTEATFFLALGLIRSSQYAAARALLGQNLLVLRKKPAPRERFFIWQGLAFYRYFAGRWVSGLSAAEEALEAALEDGFSYGKILALDLYGHLLVQVKNVDEGLKHLAEAVELAQTEGNSAAAEASRISILTYEAQYGLRPKSIVSKLRSQLKSRPSSDTYSRASLLLELARQLMLRGQLGEVRSYLDQASRLIYMYQNRRQEAVLNLRWAYLSFISGESYRALGFAQAAQRCLDPQVDRTLELQALGLMSKITHALQLNEQHAQLQATSLKLSRHFGGMAHRRMLARRGLLPRVLDAQGDRLGELLDGASTQDILQSGLWLLLYEHLGVPWAEKTLWLDMTPGVSVVFDQGRVHTLSGLTPLMRKLLLALTPGSATKEELIQEVWGHQHYHPLRHDQLIYSTVTGLRKILGPSAHWLETTEAGYRLTTQLRIRSQELPAPRVAGGPSLLPGLNHRQISFLKKAKAGEFVHVRAYQKLFQVAEITACRDLAKLMREGYVVRVGRARATRYTVAHDNL